MRAPRNRWNDLVKIKDNTKAPKEIVAMAKMLLSQLNTAGGFEIMGWEAWDFAEEHKTHYEQSI